MAALDAFLRELFDDGRVVFRGRPEPSPRDRTSTLAVLRAAFEDHRLDVAGPLIPFDPDRAFEAAELFRIACWFLLNRSEPAETVAKALELPRPPRTAAEHLSADLVLRFAPQIHRRARALAADDTLATFLADLLRRFPLSGVLSDLEEGPQDVGDLGGHQGLWMLYAERLARRESPAWRPGPALMDHVELVFQGLGKGRSPALLAAPGPIGSDDATER
jgi:hypothetical protein